jgi:hypothetical protein
MGRGRKCCCGGTCCASAFTFDFEFIRHAGVGATTTIVAESGICDALNEEADEGTSLDRLVGSIRFFCGQDWTYDAQGSSVSYSPNSDLGGPRPSYYYATTPSIPNRCTDPGCLGCDDTITRSWVITNDATAITDAAIGLYASLPPFFTNCPGLPTTPTNGFYRVVWIEVGIDSDRASRETRTYQPWNGGSCPADTDTTGTPSNRTGAYRFAYIWDCSSMCDEGTLVSAFTWEDLTYECVSLLPDDNTTPSTTVTEYRCSFGENICGCTTGGFELKSTGTTTAYLFNLTDATYSNWALEP